MKYISTLLVLAIALMFGALALWGAKELILSPIPTPAIAFGCGVAVIVLFLIALATGKVLKQIHQ